MNEVLSRLRTGTAAQQSAGEDRELNTGQLCLLAQNKIAELPLKSKLDANSLGGDKTLRKSASDPRKSRFCGSFWPLPFPLPSFFGTMSPINEL